MSNKLQLINLYCVICQHYDNRLVYDAQRTSNNFLPQFTDEECITIALWGLANRKYTCKDVFKFTKAFYGEWFGTQGGRHEPPTVADCAALKKLPP